MKRGYAVTYVKMFFIILIIVVIAFGVIKFLKIKFNEEQFETIKTDMLLIDGKIKIIAEKVNIKEKDASYVGEEIKNKKEEQKIKDLQEKNVIDIDSEEHIYYILEKEHLNQLGLNNIQLEKGFYIADYKTNEIIYSEGILDANKNVLYKLSEIKNVK